MDEDKRANKDFFKLFLVLVLALTMIGIFIYFMYNSSAGNGEILQSNNMNNLDANNINELTSETTTIKELGVDDLVVSSLYKYIEKTPTDAGQYYIEDTFYKDGKTEYKDLSDEVKILAVFQNLTDEDCTQVDATAIKDKLQYQIDDGKVKLYSKETFNKKLKEIFGENATVNYKSIEGCGEIIDYLKNDQEFAYYIFPGGGFGSYGVGMSILYKAEKVGDNIYLYDRYVYKKYNEDETMSLYTSSDKKEKIDTTDYNLDTTINEYIKTYGEKIKSYKHTFKKDVNGEYHWVSTEQI